MALIDTDYIARLNDQPILDLVNALGIKYRGGGVEKQLSCITPDHEDAQASMSVNEASGAFYCQGCGCSGGGALDMYAQHMGMDMRRDFAQVVVGLSDKLAMSVIYQENNSPAQHKRDRLAEALSSTIKDSLQMPSDSSERSDYVSFLNDRGLTPEDQAKFKFGYLPKNFARSATAQKYKDELIEIGVLQEFDNNPTPSSPYAGRIVFPITNESGKLIALSGRVLKDDPNKKVAKYRNTNESVLFVKNKELFGLSNASKARVNQGGKRLDNIFVVEGYMDVITPSRFGIDNVVSPMGTSFSDAQMKKISRQANEVTFVFDPDPAGLKASYRALLVAVSHAETPAKFSFLPEINGTKLDPDSFIKTHGPDTFKKYIADHSINTADFAVQYVLGSDPITTALDLEKTGSIDRMKDIYSAMPSGIIRTIFSEELAQKIGNKIGISLSAKTFGIEFDAEARLESAEGEIKKSQRAASNPSTALTAGSATPNTLPSSPEQEPTAPPLEFKKNIFSPNNIPNINDLILTEKGEVLKVAAVNEGVITSTTNQSLETCPPPTDFVIFKKIAETRSKFANPGVAVGDRIINYSGKWVAQLNSEIFQEAKKALVSPKNDLDSSVKQIVLDRSLFSSKPPVVGSYALLSNGDIIKALDVNNGLITRASNQKHEVFEISQNLYPVVINSKRELKQKFNVQGSEVGDRIILLGKKDWVFKLTPEDYQAASSMVAASPDIISSDESTFSRDKSSAQTDLKAISKSNELTLSEGMLVIDKATGGKVFEVISTPSGSPVCADPITGDIKIIDNDDLGIINTVARTNNSIENSEIPMNHPIFKLEKGGKWLSQVPEEIAAEFYATPKPPAQKPYKLEEKCDNSSPSP